MKPNALPERTAVPKNLRDWAIPWPNYEPPTSGLAGTARSVRNPFGRTGLAGTGHFRHLGPNYTADVAVIVKSDENGSLVLLIERADNRALAFPGGKLESGENARQAALRELQEEAGLTLTLDSEPIFVGPVNDPRNTDDAWFETTLFMVEAPIETLDLAKGGSDANRTVWVALSDFPVENIFLPHRPLLEAVKKAMP